LATRVAAVFGKIDELDRDKDDWPNYIERLTQFLDHNSNSPCFSLLYVPLQSYELLRNLVALEIPKT